jgi:hypothetical protein
MIYGQRVWYSKNGKVLPASFVAYQDDQVAVQLGDKTVLVPQGEVYPYLDRAKDAARNVLHWEIRSLMSQISCREAELEALEELC